MILPLAFRSEKFLDKDRLSAPLMVESGLAIVKVNIDRPNVVLPAAALVRIKSVGGCRPRKLYAAGSETLVMVEPPPSGMFPLNETGVISALAFG